MFCWRPLSFLRHCCCWRWIVVTGISAVAGYLLFQASCCCSLLLQEPCCCNAAYLAILLLLASLLCKLWFLPCCRILDVAGVLLLQGSCCCRCPAVAGILLLQGSCCCRGPAVAGVLLLQVSCCCRCPAVAGALLSWFARTLYSRLFKYTETNWGLSGLCSKFGFHYSSSGLPVSYIYS